MPQRYGVFDPPPAGSFAGLRVKDETEDRLRVADQVKQELEDSYGMVFPGRPKSSMASVPSDLYNLSNEDLGILFGDLTQWGAYISVVTAQVSLAFTEAKNVQEFRRKKIRLEVEGTNDAKDDQADLNPMVMEAAHDFAFQQAKLTLLKALKDANEEDRKLISRIITLREGEMNNEKRASSVRNFKHRTSIR